MGIRFSAVEVEAGWRSWKSGRKPDDDPGASLPWTRSCSGCVDARMHAIKGTVPREKYASGGSLGTSERAQALHKLRT